MSSDILVEYNKDSLVLILNILKQKLPQKIRQYNYLYSYLHHYDKINKNRNKIYSDRWNVKFYGPRDGDIQNCTIVTINGTKDYVITVFTLEESMAELKECLEKTNLINWKNPNFNIMFDESLFDMVNEVACKNGSDWFYPPVENVLLISKEKIVQLPVNLNSLPEDLYIAPLDPEKHTKIIDDNWYYKHENSFDFIKQSIEINGGTGLFRKNIEQPICWMTTNDFLTPGFLFTLPPDRKNGYGNLVMSLELQRLVNIFNTDIFSFVSSKNEPSLALHYKLGFEIVNRNRWIEKPTQNRFQKYRLNHEG